MATLRDFTILEIEGFINASTSPPSITTPDIEEGDLLLVACFWAQGTGSQTPFTPDNMIRINDMGTSANRQGAIFAAIVSDPADFVAGIELRSGASSTRVAAVAWSYQPEGHETFTLEGLDVTGPSWEDSSMASDLFPGGVVGDIIIGVSMTNKSASTTYTVHSGDGSQIGQARSLGGPPPGSVADSTVSVWTGGTGVTFNTNQANGQTYSIGITVSTGVPVTTGDGSSAHATYLDALSVRSTPKSIRTYYPGFPTISAMDLVPGATWAHRGGSIVWPEMSEYAYDRSAMRGYGALEFSARRTSDGVWFGLHDTSLARTSQDSGLTNNVINMTWAEVQAELNSLNSAGIPRPYYLLDDFLAKYKHHVLLVDNKSGAFNLSEFIPKLLGVPDALNRIIIKIDGVLVLNRYLEAKNNGFQVAGYWYPDNYLTHLPDRAPYTDYIGMQYDASETIWNDILAYGKKTWAHVCPDQSAYDLSILRGADFVQCSGVDVISPVR